MRSNGSLRNAFLDQIGAALSIMVSRGLGAPSLGERLVGTGRRLANEQDNVLARVALAEIIAFVRGRVGDDVGKARANDPLVVDTLSAFAETAVGLAGDSRIVLSFDRGQTPSPNY